MKNALLILLLVTASAVPIGAVGQPTTVSVIQLVATPEKFDDKTIAVIGYLKLGEWPSIALHKEDITNSIIANTIQIDPTQEMLQNRTNLSGKYVEIVGTFRIEGKQGRITFIKSCKVWSDPAHPFSEEHPVD